MRNKTSDDDIENLIRHNRDVVTAWERLLAQLDRQEARHAEAEDKPAPKKQDGAGTLDEPDN